MSFARPGFPVHAVAPPARAPGWFGRERNDGATIHATLRRPARFSGEGLTPCAGSLVERPVPMMTLCIRYTLDASKLADFEAYAQALRKPVERCGGIFVGYYLPTKIAGPTNMALGLIDFENLAAYEQYRANLLVDPEAVECLRRAEAAGCILNEDRAFLRRA
jgi:NIPSNAP